MARHHHCRTLSVESVSQTELNGGLSRGTSMEDTRHAGCLPSLPGPHKWVLSFASCHLNVKLCSGHAVLWSRRDQAGKRFCKNRFVCEKDFWSVRGRLAYCGNVFWVLLIPNGCINKIARWKGLQILILEHMWKSEISLLEQILATKR